MGLMIAPLFSGSKGNCIWIGDGKTSLLIDAGKSCAQIERELDKIKESPEMISGIIITHEHADHIAAVGVISRKFNIPVYANEETWEQMIKKCGEIRTANIRIIDTDDFYIGSLCVQPFEISHDAAHPFGYSVSGAGSKVTVITDTGVINNKILRFAQGSNTVLLESNHDIDMLKNGPYTAWLKQRILSSYGHLSNETAAKAALKLVHNGVKRIVLGHLSETNNDYETAYELTYNYLKQNGVLPGKDVILIIARGDGVTGKYEAN